MKNDMPAKSITGRDVGGGHCADANGGRGLVLSKTMEADTMPQVYGGTHCGVHEGTPPLHARDRARNQLESTTS